MTDRNVTKSNDGNDELTIYLRSPTSSTQTPTTQRLSSTLLNKRVNNESNNNIDKIEIDSDNIETPPATRRLFSTEKDSVKAESTTDLGSGNFDRFSATRRTRRYKKGQQDQSLDKDVNKIEPTTITTSTSDTVSSIPPQRPSTLALLNDQQQQSDENNAMLRVWQDKLKRRETSQQEIDAALADIKKSGKDLQHLSTSLQQQQQNRNSRLPMVTQSLAAAPVVAVTNTVLSPVMQESRPREQPGYVVAERAVTSRERRRSMIDPSQVKESMRLMSNESKLITNSPIREIVTVPPGKTILNDSTDGKFFLLLLLLFTLVLSNSFRVFLICLISNKKKYRV